MRVLVTGGAGFIGSHLVEALLARGDEVRVLDAFDDAYDPALKRRNVAAFRDRVVEGDVRDPAAVARLVEGVDAVAHLAARAGVRESLRSPALYQDVNVRGFAVLLDAARRAGARVVFASSSSVYGASTPLPFREDAPADRPVSPYAASKRAGELLAHAAWAGWGLPVTCLRFFTAYGPRQRPGMAIARFFRLARAGRPLPVFGDGDSSRDYTYVSDAVDAVLRALDRPLGFAVLNVGSGEPVRLDRLVERVARAAGRTVAVERLPEQPGDVPATLADNRAAREALGWRPTVTLDEGLARYRDWLDAAEPD